jgi:hypothetical protein
MGLHLYSIITKLVATSQLLTRLHNHKVSSIQKLKDEHTEISTFRTERSLSKLVPDSSKPLKVHDISMLHHNYRHKSVSRGGGQYLLPTDSILQLLFYQTNSLKDICNVINAPFLNLNFHKSPRSLHQDSSGPISNTSLDEEKFHTSNLSAVLFKSRIPS